uniref:Tyrosine 3-monooxygenase n=1 Tax=Cacopsylla melanoneura TaxID=428564 RepID=A0A8D8WAX6_9HEMI
MMAVAAAQKSREMFAIKKSYSIENGYPARRRSLVDDARFESIVVKQTKQSVLEEARNRANADDVFTGMPQYLQQKTPEYEYVEEKPKILEAKSSEPRIEPIAEKPKPQPEPQREEPEPERVQPQPEPIEVPEPEPVALPPSQDQPSSSNGNDQGLTEEEVILERAASESKEAENVVQTAALVLRMREGMGSLARILKTIEVFKGTVVHLETRASKMEGIQFDVLVKVDMSRRDLLSLIRTLRQSSSLGGINLLTENNVSVKGPWFPTHAKELDNCNHLMTKYEPDLDMNHPGFSDQVYRQRRKDIAEIAFKYKFGDPIPIIDYTEVEYSTWGAVFNTVIELMPKHFCQEYKDVFAKLQAEGIFTPDRIPQLEEMSNFLKSKSSEMTKMGIMNHESLLL